MRYSSLNHFPRSINRHRSLQKGRSGTSEQSLYFTLRPHVGHLSVCTTSSACHDTAFPRGTSPRFGFLACHDFAFLPGLSLPPPAPEAPSPFVFAPPSPFDFDEPLVLSFSALAFDL